MTDLQQGKRRGRTPKAITARQAEVLALKASYTTKQIADMLNITTSAVNQHVYHARKALSQSLPDSPVLETRKRIIGLLDKSVDVYERALDQGLADGDPGDKTMDRSVRVAESLLKGTQVLVGRAEVNKRDVKVSLEHKRAEMIVEHKLMSQFGIEPIESEAKTIDEHVEHEQVDTLDGDVDIMSTEKADEDAQAVEVQRDTNEHAPTRGGPPENSDSVDNTASLHRDFSESEGEGDDGVWRDFYPVCPCCGDDTIEKWEFTDKEGVKCYRCELCNKSWAIGGQ